MPIGASKISNFGLPDAIPDSVVDNFEAADADPPGVYVTGETLTDYYSGATGIFGRTTDQVPVGGHAVESAETSGAEDQMVVSEPEDGLNRYPEPEDTVKCLMRDVDDGNERAYPGLVVTAVFDNGNVDCYAGSIDSRENEITTRKYEAADPTDAGPGDSRTVMSTESVTINSGSWYWVEFDTPDETGSMEFRIYDYDDGQNERGSLLQTANTTDTDVNNQNRGVGLMKADGRLQDTTTHDEIEVLD